MEIELTLKNYRCFPDTRPARIILRKGFTAFVGVNNSGKSSLLKFFYEFRPLFQQLFEPKNIRTAFNKGNLSFGKAASIFDIEELFCNNNTRPIQIEIRFGPSPSVSGQDGLPIPNPVTITIPRPSNTWEAEFHIQGASFDVSKVTFDGPILTVPGARIADFSHFFECAKMLFNTLYIGPFRNAINVGTKEDYFDIQVGQSFIKKWRQLKTGDVKKNNEAIYNLTEDIRRLFQFDDLDISPSSEDKTLQVFINGRSYKLPELGSGLTQFILVFGNAAMRRPSYVLIDEPELNLHPSLQLDFLTTLGSYASEGVLFGTHNIGLARASAERVCSVRKIGEGESELTDIEATPRLSEFLGELGFSGYRDLGFNKVLLVEGASDVRTVQQFLRLYKKDHRVLLLPLGGEQLIKESPQIELEEIKRISDDVYALIDSERTTPTDPLSETRQLFAQACEEAEIKCRVLNRRSIENYFSDRAVKAVKGEKYQALGEYERLKDAPLAWAKAENWRIAREMTREELESTDDLGTFLESL